MEIIILRGTPAELTEYQKAHPELFEGATGATVVQNSSSWTPDTCTKLADRLNDDQLLLISQFVAAEGRLTNQQVIEILGAEGKPAQSRSGFIAAITKHAKAVMPYNWLIQPVDRNGQSYSAYQLNPEVVEHWRSCCSA